MENNYDLLHMIKTRRSIRKYKDKEIPEELILKVIEAGRWSPSASNRQPWRFLVLTDRDLVRNTGDLCSVLGLLNRFAVMASAIIVIFSESRHRWVNIDCGMCAENIMLEAHSLDLGTCFIGAFKEKEIKRLLNLPKTVRIIGLITLGYPDEERKPTTRYNIEDIAFFNRISGVRKGFGKSFLLYIGDRFLKLLQSIK